MVRAALVLLFACLASTSCDRITAGARNSGGVGSQRAGTARPSPIDSKASPPASEPVVSLRTKFTASGVTNGGFRWTQSVQQWVFQPADDTEICVGDDAHCIVLSKLKEQLYRPPNDPLGIREPAAAGPKR